MKVVLILAASFPPFNRSEAPGDILTVSEELGNDLIEAGVAEPVLVIDAKENGFTYTAVDSGDSGVKGTDLAKVAEATAPEPAKEEEATAPAAKKASTKK